MINNKEIEDKNIYQKLILVSKVSEFIEPILVIIKCQLIAYYVDKMNECDIDKTKNLAKKCNSRIKNDIKSDKNVKKTPYFLRYVVF